MIPLIVLTAAFVLLRIAGFYGVSALNQTDLPLRIALALMFLVTASAHWGKARKDLIAMVPPAFPNPAQLVTLTGVLEILGALGLLVPATARPAAICLEVLLIALFPANIYAARQHLTLLGRPVPGISLRTLMQAIFLAALIVVAVHAR